MWTLLQEVTSFVFELLIEDLGYVRLTLKKGEIGDKIQDTLTVTKYDDQ